MDPRPSFPNFIAEVLLLTQEVVLHPGLHRTAVQGLVMEVSHLRDPCSGLELLLV